jgi:hypothetical protein
MAAMLTCTLTRGVVTLQPVCHRGIGTMKEGFLPRVHGQPGSHAGMPCVSRDVLILVLHTAAGTCHAARATVAEMQHRGCSVTVSPCTDVWSAVMEVPATVEQRCNTTVECAMWQPQSIGRFGSRGGG